jgi:hypothetical protein
MTFFKFKKEMEGVAWIVCKKAIDQNKSALFL